MQTGEEGEYNTHSVFPQNWRESWREGNGERGYYWCATVAYILHPLSALSLMCESVKVEEEEEEEEGCHSRTMRHFSSLFPFAPFLSISSPIAVSPSFPPPRPTPIQCQILSLRWRGTREEEGQSRERRRANCKYRNLFYSFAFLLYT